jgi:hypothetical protein
MRAEKHLKKVLLEVLKEEAGEVPSGSGVIRAGKNRNKIERSRRRGFHIKVSRHVDTPATPARVEAETEPRKIEWTPRLRKPPDWLKRGGMETGSRSR